MKVMIVAICSCRTLVTFLGTDIAEIPRYIRINRACPCPFFTSSKLLLRGSYPLRMWLGKKNYEQM